MDFQSGSDSPWFLLPVYLLPGNLETPLSSPVISQANEVCVFLYQVGLCCSLLPQSWSCRNSQCCLETFLLYDFAELIHFSLFLCQQESKSWWWIDVQPQISVWQRNFMKTQYIISDIFRDDRKNDHSYLHGTIKSIFYWLENSLKVLWRVWPATVLHWVASPGYSLLADSKPLSWWILQEISQTSILCSVSGL